MSDCIKFFFVFLGILILVSCNDSTGGSEDIVLTKTNNGQTIEKSINEDIVIELPSNPSTGYQWEFTNPDGNFIYQDGESTFIENNDCSGLDGCDGKERFIFKAGSTGSGSINIVYHFEEESVEQFEIDVIVN